MRSNTYACIKSLAYLEVKLKGKVLVYPDGYLEMDGYLGKGEMKETLYFPTFSYIAQKDYPILSKSLLSKDICQRHGLEVVTSGKKSWKVYEIDVRPITSEGETIEWLEFRLKAPFNLM